MIRLNQYKEGVREKLQRKNKKWILDKKKKKKRQMVRDRQEVTTETDMSHTSEHDTWQGNITFLSVSLATSHFYNRFLGYSRSLTPVAVTQEWNCGSC